MKTERTLERWHYEMTSILQLDHLLWPATRKVHNFYVPRGGRFRQRPLNAQLQADLKWRSLNCREIYGSQASSSSSSATWWEPDNGSGGIQQNGTNHTKCERVVHRHGAILSLCVSAVVLILLGSDVMEVDEQDREQVDSERNGRGARERRKTKREQETHAQICDIMDDMQME